MAEDEQQRQDAPEAVGDASPDAAGGPPDGFGGGLRLLGAAVTLPWTFLYGITGVWAVALAARAAGQGLKRVDAGYTRFVTPPQLAFVGALLLTAFAVMLACGLLLLFRRQSGAAWLPLLLVAAGLTAGAVWAGVSGGIHPLIWVLLFFGLVYVTVVALVTGAQGDGGRAPWQNRRAMSTSIFVGHAKPPSNTVSGQMYTILSVVCEVDMESGVIVAAEFTVATDLAKDYLNRLLSGRDLNTDEDAIVAELEKCYFSGTQKALIQCFRDMAKRYRAQVGPARPETPARPAG